MIIIIVTIVLAIAINDIESNDARSDGNRSYVCMYW